MLAGSLLPLAELALLGARKSADDVHLKPLDHDREESRLLYKAGVLDSKAYCVSLLGATHAGKSFFLNRLVGLSGDSQLREAAPGEIAPTTMGSKSLLWPTGLEKFPVVRLVDYEGAHGGNAAPVELEESNDSTWKACAGEDQEALWALRRDAASRLIPRMAYLTSDVLIYITTSDPANHSTISECANIIERCVKDADRERPSLLFIFNKMPWSQFRAKSHAEFQELFLKQHNVDKELVPTFFHEIRALRLPVTEEDDSEQRQQAFADAVDGARQAVVGLLAGREKLRKRCGTGFNNAIWRLLYNELCGVVTTHNHVYMSEHIFAELFARAGDGDCTRNRHAIAVFQCACHFQPVITSVEMFLKHFRTSTRQIAASYAFNACAVTGNIGTDMGDAERKNVLENFRQTAANFARELFQNLALCGATHKGHKNANLRPGESITCTVRRGDHDDHHIDRLRQIGANNLDQGTFVRFFVGKVLRRTGHPTWKGPWVEPRALQDRLQAVVKDVSDELIKILSAPAGAKALCFAYAWLNLHRGVLARATFTTSSIDLDPNAKPSVTFPSCSVCLGENDGDRSTVLPCGHKMCEPCQENLRSMCEEHLENVIQLLGWDLLAVTEMHWKLCPFC